MFAVAPKPLLEYFDGPVEVVAERQQQVDVVEVPTATEAVSQVVARVHCGAKFAAFDADEAEIALDLLRNRALSAEFQDRDVHRQVISDRTESFVGDPTEVPLDLGRRFVKSR